MAKQLQRTAEQIHYSGSVLLTHTHARTQDSTMTRSDSEYYMTHYSIHSVGKGQQMKEVVEWNKVKGEKKRRVGKSTGRNLALEEGLF